MSNVLNQWLATRPGDVNARLGIAPNVEAAFPENGSATGYTPDQRPYEMWAKTAVQDVTDPDRVELNKLRTKLLMQDGSTVFLDSLTGLFDNKAQTLDLHKDIFLKTTTGYEARLTQAHVDMVKNTIDSRVLAESRCSFGSAWP